MNLVPYKYKFITTRHKMMRPIPGSSRLAGGELLCMFHTLEPALILDDWPCKKCVYACCGRVAKTI